MHRRVCNCRPGRIADQLSNADTDGNRVLRVKIAVHRTHQRCGKRADGVAVTFENHAELFAAETAAEMMPRMLVNDIGRFFSRPDRRSRGRMRH